MNAIALKFGGSSTADADMLLRVLEIIRQRPERRYIVLSAPGTNGTHPVKVTDMLRRCWACRGDPASQAYALDAVIRRFDAIARGLGLDDMEDEIRRTLRAALGISLPHVLSRGEYLCARLFARYSGIPMVDAADLIAFDAGGFLDEKRTLSRIAVMAERLPMAVIPGFYGSDPEGNIAVLPRNGSDITGALVAAGVGAALYENWTDVPGLMTADPAVDPGARLIPDISFADFAASARRFAQALHPDSLGPVARAGIPIRVCRTLDPDAPGTLIHM